MPHVFVEGAWVEIDAAAHGNPLDNPVGNCPACGVPYLLAQGHICRPDPDEIAFKEAPMENETTEYRLMVPITVRRMDVSRSWRAGTQLPSLDRPTLSEPRRDPLAAVQSLFMHLGGGSPDISMALEIALDSSQFSFERVTVQQRTALPPPPPAGSE